MLNLKEIIRKWLGIHELENDYAELMLECRALQKEIEALNGWVEKYRHTIRAYGTMAHMTDEERARAFGSMEQ